jgi:hypothetical protein
MEIGAARGSESLEVVFGPSPDRLAVPCTRSVSVRASAERFPYLEDHRIQGDAVIPLVLVQEWFLRALRATHPSHRIFALEELQVLKGIVLDEADADSFVLEWKPASEGAQRIDLIDKDGHRRFSAKVVTTQTPPVAPIRVTGAALDRIPPHWLFHGPQFQGLKEVTNLDDAGATARVVGLTDQGWPKEAWVSDPLILDSGLQLARVWGWQTLEMPTLPTRLARTDILVPGPIEGVVTVSFVGKKRPSGLSGDLTFTDSRGRMVARLLGLEMYKSSEATADPHALRS